MKKKKRKTVQRHSKRFPKHSSLVFPGLYPLGVICEVCLSLLFNISLSFFPEFSVIKQHF